MSTATHPAAGGGAGQQEQNTGGSAEQARPGRRPRGGKDDKTLELDFTSNEELLADLRALAQVMKFDLNAYLISAIEAKYKSDTERVRKDFNSKSK